MSENSFESLTSSFLTSNDDTRLKILCHIRKRVEWPKNKDNIRKLRHTGCLKELVGSLQSPQKAIVDISLSILGNCCMEEKSARDSVRQHSLLSQISQVIKKRNKQDSINGRIFRVIGNICHHKDICVNTIVNRKSHIIEYIVQLLKAVGEDKDSNEVSHATIVMAIRCLRELVNSQTVIALVKKFNVLNAVGLLLLKYSPHWTGNKENETILINLLKLLQEYSRFKYYPSITEMRNTAKGDSLACLSHIIILAPRRIVKIIMNFIRISQLKSDLPIPEICEGFVEALENYSILEKFNGEFVEYIQCLCYLLDHPSNRNTERCKRSIPLLIQILKDFQTPSNCAMECCILIISTLGKCRYNEQIIGDQLRTNIVDILVKKLEWIGGSSKTLNIKHRDEKKRTYHFAQASLMKKKKLGISCTGLWEPKSPTSSHDDPEFLLSNKFDRSPSPSSGSESEMAMSWSSPGSSSNFSRTNDLNESDSDDYSPVCSEADPLEFPLTGVETVDENSSGVEKIDDIEIEDDHVVDIEVHLESSTTSSIKLRLLSEIVNLLKIYILMKPPASQMFFEDLIINLVKCSGYFEWTYSTDVDTIDIISKIFVVHEYLLPILLSNITSIVYPLTEVQHGLWCIKCKQYQNMGNNILKKITDLAESSAGLGIIAHTLLKSNDLTKRQLLLSFPYVVRQKSFLEMLMLCCNGLDILVELLRNGESDLQQKSIKVLCAMASRTLEIANPKQQFSALDRPKIVAENCGAEVTPSITVTFQLDDGCSVRADRNFLCEKSDFFNVLLKGDFKESRTDVVTLHQAGSKALKCLINLLHCDFDKTEVVEIELDLDILLEVIVLCDRFLLVDLCIFLTDCVQSFQITDKSVPKIYKWSVESATNFLRVESIAFALVGEILDTDRYQMFKKLFALGYSEELAEDIHRLLTRYISVNAYDALSNT